MSAHDELLQRLPDGTVKQRNPFTGTQVWTMPGRGKRPLPASLDEPTPLPPGGGVPGCAFCPGHHLDNPPERSRLVRDGGGWRTLASLSARELDDTQAEFRRVPNLFEICSLDYWRLNHGVEPGAEIVERVQQYLSDEAGREHLRRVWLLRSRFTGGGDPSVDDLRQAALGWFGTTHELVIPRRHHVDGATQSSDLTSSGRLSVHEHRAYVALTVQAMADLYAANRAARYVSVFQNWLKPAGASFEHLHRQVVAIDEVGEHVQAAADALARNPRAFNEYGLDMALRHGLMLAANDHAIAFAGFGHRYPSVEIYSLSPRREPWLLSDEERDGMADILHAIHAAGGRKLSCNEEWHHRPPALEDGVGAVGEETIPWRIVLKWRISTLAGFEGDTKIYLNTLSPWDVRDRVLPELLKLREQGHIAPVQIGDECDVESGSIPT
ncbi:DUF4921 family protein [Luteococcus japonicus]|uniref:No significant database matches n=1 Tax=Luteococcus japonicus LSP_Lj1 TaxID=1255658 RepID=A0A1R4KAE3_9ACTN|nr:DUF4921 family protein [Luteococcus japonicus]SJN41381.1 No significant database matches [Luteococcus japonicus LSP_Lj1]